MIRPCTYGNRASHCKGRYLQSRTSTRLGCATSLMLPTPRPASASTSPSRHGHYLPQSSSLHALRSGSLSCLSHHCSGGIQSAGPATHTPAMLAAAKVAATNKWVNGGSLASQPFDIKCHSRFPARSLAWPQPRDRNRSCDMR